jgi:hypothetical protein
MSSLINMLQHLGSRKHKDKLLNGGRSKPRMAPYWKRPRASYQQAGKPNKMALSAVRYSQPLSSNFVSGGAMIWSVEHSGIPYPDWATTCSLSAKGNLDTVMQLSWLYQLNWNSQHNTIFSHIFSYQYCWYSILSIETILIVFTFPLSCHFLEKLPDRFVIHCKLQYI